MIAANSISSPTAAAVMPSPRRSTSTIGTSPSCAPRRAAKADPTADSRSPRATLCYKRAMTIASMTGFARAEGHDGPLSWAWELKSVNSKSLDLRFRLPPGFDALELPLRALVTQRLKRGAISAGLSVARASGAGNLRVNREALAVVLRLANELAHEVEAAPPRIDGLLALRGVLESGDDAPEEGARERQMKQLSDGFAAALEGLAAMRLSEGARLEAV